MPGTSNARISGVAIELIDYDSDWRWLGTERPMGRQDDHVPSEITQGGYRKTGIQ